MTRDVDRALSYYENVLGWRFYAMPFGEGFSEYHLALKDGRPIAGCQDINSVDYLDVDRDFWLAFMAVEDCDMAAELAQDAGGSVLRQPADLPNIGRVAILGDCCGALHGLITPMMQN